MMIGQTSEEYCQGECTVAPRNLPVLHREWCNTRGMEVSNHITGVQKSDRSDPANYRPVSLTCVLCKILEHIVHPVQALRAAFCMTCSLLMLVGDAIGDHMDEAYSRVGLMTAL